MKDRPTLVEFDKEGRVTHYKQNGTEYFYEYDEDGRKTVVKTSDGYELHLKYDEEGNLIDPTNV